MIEPTLEHGRELLDSVILEARKGLSRKGFTGPPGKWEAYIEPIARWYGRAQDSERARFRASIGEDDWGILTGISIELCTAAARSGNLRLLELALMCHVLEDGRLDERQTLQSLTVVRHVSEKLGAASDQLIGKAMSTAGERARRCMRDILHRPYTVQTLNAMGWEEVNTPEGVSYRVKNVPFPKW